MNEKIKKNLLPVTILILFLSYGIYFYMSLTRESYPGETEYRLGNEFLEKQEYENALIHLDRSIEINPDLAAAYMAKGISLMYLNKFDESRKNFNKAIELKKDFAEAYANRGILNDKDGKYEDALRDYKKAIKLKPKLTEGPGWFWRFLRNIHEKPPTILDRAIYLTKELKKPEGQRKLRFPEIDSRQRMYKP